MSNKRKTTFLVVLLIITNILTFTFTNLFSIPLKNKVIVPKDEYNQLTTAAKKYSKVTALEDFIEKHYLNEVDEETMLDGQLKGLFQSLEDPYSQYMSKDEFQDFMEHTKGVYGGVGVIVTPGDDNLITVVAPIEDTPGEKAGIKTGDKIIKVNGEEFTADKMDAAVKLMKGEPGTDVDVTIMRKDKEGKTKQFDVSITREEIRLKTVKADVIDEDIGYVKITSFDDLTYDDFEVELEELKKKDVKGIIMDLRNNPGGLLDVCVDIADEFLGEGVVVYTETRNGEKEYLKSDKKKTDIPLVLLINEGSASASEIMAGAMRDKERAVLIGTKTFGKGIVQRIKQLPDGSGFKLTVSEYFTPNGTSIHDVGIEPDIVVELPEDIEEIGIENLKEDTQLQKALEVIRNK